MWRGSCGVVWVVGRGLLGAQLGWALGRLWGCCRWWVGLRVLADPQRCPGRPARTTTEGTHITAWLCLVVVWVGLVGVVASRRRRRRQELLFLITVTLHLSFRGFESP